MTRTLLAEPEAPAPAMCCSTVVSPDVGREEAATLAAVFRALADPGRVLIVNLLANADEPVCVCDLTSYLGLSQPTVSFHLKKLLQAGLLRREEKGTWAYYSLDRQAMRRLRGVFAPAGRTG